MRRNIAVAGHGADPNATRLPFYSLLFDGVERQAADVDEVGGSSHPGFHQKRRLAANM
jgi:hypothetical protein